VRIQAAKIGSLLNLFFLIAAHSKTNVPNVRMAYRYETLMNELEMIVSLAIAHDEMEKSLS